MVGHALAMFVGAVPVRPVTRLVALSLICDAVIEIVEFDAAVKRPCASTVMVEKL
jgi:hypothetical protein